MHFDITCNIYIRCNKWPLNKHNLVTKYFIDNWPGRQRMYKHCRHGGRGGERCTLVISGVSHGRLYKTPAQCYWSLSWTTSPWLHGGGGGLYTSEYCFYQRQLQVSNCVVNKSHNKCVKFFVIIFLLIWVVPKICAKKWIKSAWFSCTKYL